MTLNHSEIKYGQLPCNSNLFRYLLSVSIWHSFLPFDNWFCASSIDLFLTLVFMNTCHRTIYLRTSLHSICFTRRKGKNGCCRALSSSRSLRLSEMCHELNSRSSWDRLECVVCSTMAREWKFILDCGTEWSNKAPNLDYLLHFLLVTVQK